MNTAIKIAVSGKGGVGKTTIAALLCRALRDTGYTVLAVDADPAGSLPSALGFGEDAAITPIVEMQQLIEERTGARPGTTGALFKLNPRVDDLPEKLWKEHDGIKLLLMGTVKQGGGGCICPESALLRMLMQNLLLYRREAVVMDMEAGIEHLGRATAQAVDRLVIVVEPGTRSMDIAHTIIKLAEDIGLRKTALIANKIRNTADREFIDGAAPPVEILGYMPFDAAILSADMQRLPPWELSPSSLTAARTIAQRLTGSS
jgi:CO dehydrogenase maturation factor